MTNFDHTIDEGLAEAIADGQHMANYAGWDFHAYVYLGGEGVYVADVHRFQVHRDFVEAPDLKSLMDETSERWGWQ